MKRSWKKSHIAAGAALAVSAATAKAQTLVYDFETLYDSTNTPNPAGTFPDDFRPNGGGTTITQSTTGVTHGNFSMEFAQVAGAFFTGAQTTVIPAAINTVGTVALSADITIPAGLNFGGTFARMGIIEFGTQNGVAPPFNAAQAQVDLNNEINVDLPAGTYHLTIPLIGPNPNTFNDDYFYNIFGPGPSQVTPTSLEFYINKSSTATPPATSAFNLFMDNVTAIGPSVTGTWANGSGGSWSTPGDWTGGIPQLALDTANFASAIVANSTVNLDANRSVMALNFSNSSAQYTIAQGSGGTLTLDAGGSNTSTITDSAGKHTISAPVNFNTNTTITVNNAGDMLSFTGPVSGIGGLTIAGAGTVGISGPATYIGGTTISSGTLLVGSAQSLPTQNSVVQIKSGAKMQFATGIGGVTLQLPNITAGGTLDIGNNHLIINYAGSTDPISTIIADLVSGFNGGTWTGTGITSSAAAANSGSYGVGYADSADPGNPAGLASGTLEVAYTLLGDANLDHAVNGVDFGILAANFNKGVTGWDLGDFNYDNAVNGVDFGLLAANFNKGASGAADGPSALSDPALVAFAQANGLMADVPEPCTAALAMLPLAILIRRKRRRV